MKATIEGFSQEFAVSLKKENFTNCKKIDCTDLVLLRWFVDFYPTMKKIKVDGKEYGWVFRAKMLEDLPILDISERAFSERMKKLVEFDILTYQLVKKDGTFSCYGFGKNYSKLISTTRSSSNDHPVVVQTTTKDKSIIDKSIKIKKENLIKESETKRFTPPTLEEVKEYCIERKNNVDAERFIDYYTANGWKVGRNSMKDWQAAVRTWEKKSLQFYKSEPKHCEPKFIDGAWQL